MRHLLLLAGAGALLLAATANAAEFFVSPSGSDDAAGTLDKPFATLSRAQHAAAPGDTVFLRGGTYHLAEAQIAQRQGIFARVITLDKSGEKDKPITYAAYGDEKPSFDFSQVKPDGFRVYAFAISGSWLRLKGLDVTGVQVTIKTHTQSICFESNGSHNVLERLTMHDGQAIGIYHQRGSDNLFLNCDAWNNYDYTSENGKGGNVDGFGCHPTAGSTGNVLRGCRAWFNSDDGFDLINSHEPVTIENCWAISNGYSTTFQSLGDGNGFKAGGYGLHPDPAKVPNPIPRHIIRNCLAVGNKANGFYANHHPAGLDFISNTAFRNAIDFNMLGRLPDFSADIDGFGHTLRNNLGYKARSKELDHLDRTKSQSINNSFDYPTTLKDSDFLSLDESELTTPRAKDGSLPPIQFLHPAPGKANGLGAFSTPVIVAPSH